MSASPAAADPVSAAERRAADAEYYRRALHQLIDVGGDLVRMLHAQAKAQADSPSTEAADPPLDVTPAFDRVARSIRRSIALARSLDQPPPALGSSSTHDRVVARSRIIRRVEDAIYREGAEGEQAALCGELFERMDAPDLDDDIGCRPVDDIIAEICRDLGVAGRIGKQVWLRRTPGDVAILTARAAAQAAARCGEIPFEAAVPPHRDDPPPQPSPTRRPPPGDALATVLLAEARFRGK